MSKLDLRGVEIKEGDWLVRAFNLGRCAALKYAKVLTVKEGKITTIGFEPRTYGDTKGQFYSDGGKGRISYGNRTLIVPKTEVPLSALSAYAKWKEENG